MTKRVGMLAVSAVLGWSTMIAGCAAPGPQLSPIPLPYATASAATYALRTVTDASGPCAGIGLLGATLTGDPADPRAAWLTSLTGGRKDVLFPPGFTARFTPRLEILDAAGTVVALEGTSVTEGCTTGAGLLILSR